MGRPRQYDPADFHAEICEWIAQGKTLRDYCRQEGKPSHAKVYDWLNEDEDFSLRFARARESGHDIIAQECLTIADTTQIGQIVTDKPDGSQEIKTADMIEHRKLQIHTRLQLLSKWNPKKYGDFTRNELSGPDGRPLQAEITINLVDPKNGTD